MSVSGSRSLQQGQKEKCGAEGGKRSSIVAPNASEPVRACEIRYMSCAPVQLGMHWRCGLSDGWTVPW